MSDPNLITQRQIQAHGDQIERLRKADVSGGSGSAFPAGVTTGATFFRTDLGLACYYDGTRWLTQNVYLLAFGIGSGAYATNYAATTASIRYASIDNSYQPYFIYGLITITTGTPNGAGNAMTYNFITSGATTIWSVTTNADGAAATVVKATASFTQPSAAITSVRLDIAINSGAPGAQFPYTPVLYYRNIIT